MSPPAAYSVCATKKGAVPLSIDKRRFGKLVTRVENVSGDVSALCTALKNALGAGGHVDGSCIEVQGDQREVLGPWLIAQGCVKGLRHEKPPAPAEEQDSEAAGKERRKPRWDAAMAAAHLASSKPEAACQREPRGPEYQRFVALMKSWPFWDHEYSSLPQRFTQRGRVAGGVELESCHSESAPAQSVKSVPAPQFSSS